MNTPRDKPSPRVAPATFYRHGALAALDVDQLATWLELTPVLERMAFAPPPTDPYLTRLMGERKARPVASVDALSTIADSGSGLSAIIAGLDQTAYQLLLEAAWHEGSLQLDDVITGDGWPRAQDASKRMLSEVHDAADRLRFLLLAEPADAGTGQPWLRLLSDVRHLVPLPGRTARHGLAATVSDELAATLRAGGARDIPPRREDREKALLERLTNPIHVRAIVGALDPAARSALDVLVRRIDPTPMAVIGVTYFGSVDRRFRTRTPTPASARNDTPPIYALYDVGLIGVEPYEHVLWVWREVAQILRQNLVVRWETVVAPRPVPIEADRSHIARPLAHLERLLDLWRATPPPALADGGLGVAAVRAAAKRIGIPAGHAGLLVHLAIGLGLLRSYVAGTEGRGRNARAVYAWGATDTAAEWLARPAIERWTMLVHRWLTDDTLIDNDGLPERWQPGYREAEPLRRHLVLRALEGFEPGFGAAPDEFGPWTIQRHPSQLWAVQVGAAIEAAKALGLVPPDGPIGLTASARALLGGTLDPSANVAPDPSAPATGVVVQGDYTVIAPPDVDLEARLFLDRVATLESDAGARVYRITEASLTAAMAGGLSAADIDRGLAERSRTTVPQSVSYLINDVDRKRQLVVLASAVTVIASTDPALIASATRVKAAGLRAIGPYTAVSSLAAEKVRAALAAKGVVVTVEQSAVVVPSAPRSAKAGAAKLPAVGPSPYVGRSTLLAEAISVSGRKRTKR